MTVRLLVATRSDVGRVRPGNEDAFVVADDLHLIAVADGMGGHQAGEVASEMAIALLLEGAHRGDSIGDAIAGANDAVFAKASEDLSLRGMGTTITAAIVDGDALRIGHVGDSRAYLLRAGALRQLTTDHSVIAELIAAGELTEEQAQVDPRRAMITRALGIDSAVAVDVFTVDLAPGDRLLLCSDGLTTMVSDSAIAEILAEADALDDAADALVDAANAAGGADNITVVVADVVVADVVVADVVADGAVDGDGDGDDTDATPPEGVPAVAPEAAAEVEPEHAVAGPDAELEELRAAVEETAPRRRWWQRRPRP
jgi:serine/threonine protein phosphatase PrpC